MTRKSKSLSRAAVAATLLAGGAFVGGVALADEVPTPANDARPTVAAPRVANGAAPSSLADMVAQVGPSVVQIQVAKQSGMQRMSMPFGGGGSASPFGGGADPFGSDELMRRFFGMPGGGTQQPRGVPQPRGPAQQAVGSGFIVDRSGIILTNNHVVEGASEVKVQLSDGREFTGTVLGTDPKTDVAVVRINGGGDFPAVEWGDSDRARVGDGVFAVGSPFGLGNTVTSGIISARSRDIGGGPYDDFLQVDAAINSGNSGGPLFDAEGRVIGINTAIFSPSGGNVGIGFAIPGSMARQVADQIIRDGHVSRGYLGVGLQPITEGVAQSLGLQSEEGVLIANVEPGGPAAGSGLQEGDVVRSFGGQPVKDAREFARMVAQADAGSRIPVGVVRQGRSLTLDLQIGTERRG